MKKQIHSRYIRCRVNNPIIRRWIACVLLYADLETYLSFGNVNKALVAGFSKFPKREHDGQDADEYRRWLRVERKRCGKVSFSERDVFSKNTREIQKAIGLTNVELAVLRFACLLNGFKPLDEAAEMCSSSFSEEDVCEMLSEILCLPFEGIYEALSPNGILRTSGMVSVCGKSGTGHSLRSWLYIPEVVARNVFRAQSDSDQLMSAFYQRGPKSKLGFKDFGHLHSKIVLIKKYLRQSFKEKSVGANILLWGPAGTGKTELARYFGQSLRKSTLEINTVDIQNDVMTAAARLDCYRFCQAVVGRNAHSLVVFDEVEEILSDAMYAKWGFQSSDRLSKAMINKLLEDNGSPSIWVSNNVSGVDPAYLRRFDFVVKVSTPMPAIKKQIATKVFRDVPMEDDVMARMVEHKSITAAHMEKASRICKRLGVDTSGYAKTVVRQVLNGDLEAMQESPLKIYEHEKTRPSPTLKYRPDLINCDASVQQVAKNLHADSSARFCMFGPPGTGKTAWAKHIAKGVGRPLIVKQATDLLSKYVGETEKLMAKAFNDAAKSRSILMLDEVDSFLSDRANATHQWEITQANQFLTAMEEYQGILLCTTNLMSKLDPATMRRFDFKVAFDYLKPDDAVCMTDELLQALGGDMSGTDSSLVSKRLAGVRLSHGDFANLLRRYAALNLVPDAGRVCDDLRKEAGFRAEEVSRPIGFTARLH